MKKKKSIINATRSSSSSSRKPSNSSSAKEGSAIKTTNEDDDDDVENLLLSSEKINPLTSKKKKKELKNIEVEEENMRNISAKKRQRKLDVFKKEGLLKKKKKGKEGLPYIFTPQVDNNGSFRREDRDTKSLCKSKQSNKMDYSIYGGSDYDKNDDNNPYTLLVKSLKKKEGQKHKMNNNNQETIAESSTSISNNNNNLVGKRRKRKPRKIDDLLHFQTKKMEDEFHQTVGGEKKLSSKVKSYGEDAIRQIPVEFLNSLKLKDYVMERGASTIEKIFTRVIHAHTMRAFIRWVHFTEEDREREITANITKFSQARGFKTLKTIKLRFDKGILLKAMSKWRQICLLHERNIESQAGAVEIQRIFRSFMAKRVTKLLIENKIRQKQDAAALIVQRFARSVLARKIVHMIKLNELKNEKAYVIQSFFRIVVAKGNFRRRMFAVIQEKKRKECATTIARVYRGRLARKRVAILEHERLLQRSATRIQSLVRMRFAQKFVQETRMQVFQAACEELETCVKDAERELAAMKIQAAYDKYRKKAINESAALVALEAVLCAEGNVAALAIQNKYRELQVDRVVQQLARNVDELIWQSTIQLQTYSRGVLAKKMLERLKLEERSKRIAAVKLQAARRGQLGRKQFAQQKEELVNLVRKVEKARWKQMRGRLRRRVLDRYYNGAKRLVPKIFQEWKDAVKLLIKEREERQMNIALTHLKCARLARSYHAWHANVQEIKSNREKISMALSFMRHQRMAKTFYAWSKLLQNFKLWQLLNSKIYLICCDLSTYNSKRQRALVKLAAALYDSQKLRFGLHGWKQLMQLRADQINLAQNWYEERWRVRTPKFAFDGWFERMEYKKFRRSQVELAKNFYIDTLKKKAFNHCKQYIIYLAHRRLQHAQAEASRDRLFQKRAIGLWKAAIQEIKTTREKFSKSIEHDRKSSLRIGFIYWGLGLKAKKLKRKAYNDALEHYENTIKRKVFLEIYKISHFELFKKRTAAAEKIQNQWRMRQARLRRFQIWAKIEYLKEREAKRKEEERRMLFRKRRQLQILGNKEDFESLLEKNRADSSNILLVLFTAPWITERSYYNQEATLALANEQFAEEKVNCSVWKTDLELVGMEFCNRVRVENFPSILPFWQGKAFTGTETIVQLTKFARMAVKPVLRQIMMIPSLPRKSEQMELCETDEEETKRVEKVVAVVSICCSKAKSAQVKAVTKIQNLYKTKKSNRLLGLWQEAVMMYVEQEKERVIKEKFKKIDFFEYLHEDKENRKFFFNHKDVEATWDKEPLEHSKRPIKVILVTRTGHKIVTQGLTGESSVKDICKIIEQQRNIKESHQKLYLRPEGVWFDGVVISGIVNRHPTAKIGVGAKNIEVMVDGEWMPCNVVNVYEDESVDVQVERKTIKKKKNEDTDEKGIDDKAETKTGEKKEEEMKAEDKKEEEMKTDDKKEEMKTDDKKEEMKSDDKKEEEDENTIDKAKDEIQYDTYLGIPRDEIRIKELNKDSEETLFNLGMKNECVVEVEELADESDIKDETVKKFGVHCSQCKLEIATLYCRECQNVFCFNCTIQRHINLNKKVDGGSEEEDEDGENDDEEKDDDDDKENETFDEFEYMVKNLNEFDEYLVKREYTRHTVFRIDVCEISKALHDQVQINKKNKPDVIMETNSLKVCQLCNVRIPRFSCVDCEDVFCDKCFNFYHEYGSRITHEKKAYAQDDEAFMDLGVDVNLDLLEKKKWINQYLVDKEHEEKQEKERIIKAERDAAAEIIRDAFERYDADGSGHLDAAELTRFLREEICEPISDEEVLAGIEEMDEDGNGLIDFDELLNWFINLQKQEGRDSSKMKMLRMSLQAKKRARMLKSQLNSLLPKEKLENTRKYLEEQAKKWMEKRPPVPGYPNVYQIRMIDFESKLRLFQRYVRREFGIIVDLSKSPKHPWSEEKTQRVRLAFESIFLPEFNSGNLSKVYYNDNLEFTHFGKRYLQTWDDEKDMFIFTDLESGEKSRMNPVLKEKYHDEVKRAFVVFDKDGNGDLDRTEVRRLLEDELCIKVSKEQLDKAMQDMDRDETGTVDFEELLYWYTKGIDMGESRGMSGELRRKRRMRRLKKQREKLRETMMNGTANVGRNIATGAMNKARNTGALIKSAGKGPLYRELVESGWEPSLVEKAIHRCKNKPQDDLKAAVLTWLEENK